jgi:endonuclease/exonuclease/phosphatase family metal-dependent hydrolase
MGLIEINPKNRKYTWTNKQEKLVLVKIDRVFISPLCDSAFPLARVKALERLPSDHNPLLVDTGDNVFYGKKRFRFKWWLEQDLLER